MSDRTYFTVSFNNRNQSDLELLGLLDMSESRPKAIKSMALSGATLQKHGLSELFNQNEKMFGLKKALELLLLLVNDTEKIVGIAESKEPIATPTEPANAPTSVSSSKSEFEVSAEKELETGRTHVSSKEKETEKPKYNSIFLNTTGKNYS